MDLEKRARRQSLRVFISESLMVLFVIITVVLLVLLVSGYGINSEFEVERQGMLQIYSFPTGANVEVDGEASWFQRTNTSKVLASGEHRIVLEKDGYDTWAKTVTISEGLLYRVHYPRLFLQNREKTTISENFHAATFASVSPDRKTMLIIEKNSDWTLLNLDQDTPTAKTLQFGSLLSSSGDDKTVEFKGTVTSAAWATDNNRVLLNTDRYGWLLIDVKNPEKSLKFTRAFDETFASVRIFDNSAENLLVTRDHKLYKLNVASLELSKPIAAGLTNYDFYGQNIVFTTADGVYLKNINDENANLVLETKETPRVFISRFYDDKYITLITNTSTGAKIQVLKYNDFSPVYETTLDFTPETVKIGTDGAFVFLKFGAKVATVDMEALFTYTWELDDAKFGWLDNNMVYNVTEGELSVFDFDGLNRRVLAQKVSANLPVTITADKWLYYFNTDGDLIRELIAR